MKKYFVRIMGILSLTLSIASCGSDSQPQEQAPAVEPVEELTDADLAEADQMIKEMPSPIEMAILVKHAGGDYNPKLLNDIKRIDTYVTNGKKTINMGIYSADVGYTSLYKQTQETVFYLNNINKLSDAIGLTEAFDPSVFSRVETNIENRDSLLFILSGAYDVANEYLKNNDRMNTSVLMIGGGWVESMYLASNLGDNGGRPQDIIALRILEQEVVLQKIITTMKMVKGDALVDEFVGKLEGLNKILVLKDIQIGKGEDATVDRDKMNKVFDLIDAIRDWAVTG